jgi:UDP-N-acetylglucosamine transferase subunit ALG13
MAGPDGKGARHGIQGAGLLILVSVGTTIPFDDLIAEVDRLCGDGFFAEEVVCQIGRSTYTPENCDYFRNKPNLERDFYLADGLIVHGGTGSTIQALCAQTPFVAVANPRARDDHQADFLSVLSREYDFVWSRDPSELASLWQQAVEKQKTGQRVSDNVARLVGQILAVAKTERKTT